MTNSKSRYSFVLLVVITTVITAISPSAQGFVYWSNSSGSATNFDWYDGGSDYGLFGDAVLTADDVFAFFPSCFRAQSVDGVAAITYDRLQFRIVAHEGYVITGLNIVEYGDYGIFGTGAVSVSGSMFLTNREIFEVAYDSFQSDPASPISSGEGSWSAEVGVDNIEWSDFTVVLDNNLMAVSQTGSITFIEKKTAGVGVGIELIVEQIPEPATIAVLALGLPLFGRFSRKSR